MVNSKQSLELVHFYLQYFELVGEQLFKPLLHEVFKESVTILRVSSLDEQISCDVVHPLTVADFFVRIGIHFQYLGQYLWLEVVNMHMQRSIYI